MGKLVVLAAGLLLLGGGVRSATVRVECESFETLGGWTVETQSMRQQGSSYLMAHGYGVPVSDAETTVKIPAAGRYVVWARTRDWAAAWRAKGSQAPGRFEIRIGDWKSGDLGTEGQAWHWVKAGEVELAAGASRVALHDLTGFNGRCDALFFASAGEIPSETPPPSVLVDDPAAYDLIVVGGGVSGCAAALAASRYNL